MLLIFSSVEAMDGCGPSGDVTNTLNRRKRQSHDHPDSQAVQNGKSLHAIFFYNCFISVLHTIHNKP